MRTSDYRRWSKVIDDLSLDQLCSTSQRVSNKLADNEVNFIIQKRFSSKPLCPRCSSKVTSKWGKEYGIQRYRCDDCKRTFNTLTGTPFARLREKEQWSQYSKSVEASQSVRKAAKECKISIPTSFRWRHRWLTALNNLKDRTFAGIVEADETYILESHKGSKTWARSRRGEPTAPPPNRLPRKRGGKAKKRGLSKEQIPVLVVRDRHGATTDEVLSDVSTAAIKTVLKPVMTGDNILCTDSHSVYRRLSKQEGFAHQPVNLKSGTRVKLRVYHVQNVNAYHSRFKSWMAPFRGVATKYLSNYLGWRRFFERYSNQTTHPSALSEALCLT